MAETQEGSLLLEMFEDDRLAFLLSAVDAKGLGRLACTARRFSTKVFSASEPYGEQWTLIEEAARIQVNSYPDAVRQLVAPRQEGEAWLRMAAALAPMAMPLLFNLPLAEDRTTLTRHICIRHGDYDTVHATCEQPAASGVGRQYVEFTAVQLPTVPLHPTYEDYPYSLETSITVGLQSINKGQNYCSWMLHLQGWADSEYGMQFGTQSGVLEHTPPKTSIWANHGVLHGDDGWRPDTNNPDGYRESTYTKSLGKCCWGENYCPRHGGGWPSLTKGDRVGLLWDADTGNLAVFVNGVRKGFANARRWMGEIKGDLRWRASITSELNAESNGGREAVAKEQPQISLQIKRCPPPAMSQAECQMEREELTAMAKAKARREAEVAEMNRRRTMKTQ